MNPRLQAAVTVLLSELRMTLRDPRVLVTAIGVPLVLWPGSMWAVSQVSLLSEAVAERQPPRVQVEGPDDVVEALLVEPVVATEATDPIAGEVDAVVSAVPRGDALDVRVQYLSTRPRSQRALDLVDDRLDDVRQRRIDALAQGRGVDPAELQPWAIDVVDESPADKLVAFVASLMLPLMVVMILPIGGLYTATGLVVSEREQGSLETVLATRVPRVSLILGKLGAVVSLMLGVAAINVATMSLTVAFTLRMLAPDDPVELVLEPVPVLVAGFAVVVTAVLVSALLVAAVVHARTFKEGEGLGSLVVVLCTVPVIAFMMEEDPGLALALVPLANTMLVIKAALMATLSGPFALVTLATNGLLAGLLLWVAGRSMQDTERFLLGALPRPLQFLERYRD